MVLTGWRTTGCCRILVWLPNAFLLRACCAVVPEQLSRATVLRLAVRTARCARVAGSDRDSTPLLAALGLYHDAALERRGALLFYLMREQRALHTDGTYI